MKKMRKVVSMLLMVLMIFLLTEAAVPLEVSAAQKVKKISLKTSTGRKTIYVGGPSAFRYVTIKPTITPKKASKKVTYKSSKKSVATVNSKGRVKAKKKGTTTITVRSKTNPKVKKTIKITVKNYTKRVKPKGLSAKISKTTISSGKTAKITATIKPASTTNKNLKYKSYAASLATVNSKGKITANKKGKSGTVKIRVYTSDKNKKGKKLFKDFYVKINAVKVSSIRMSTRITIPVGSVRKLYPTISPANATNKKITWSSSNKSRASISSSGKITAKSMGSVNITAKSNNGKTAVCKVMVSRKWVSVHDPSVVVDNDGTYYVFGTHFGAAKSTDMIGWDGSVGGTKLFGRNDNTIVSKLNNIYKWINNSGLSLGNTWAADVIYNKTTKKYYYYACTSDFGTTNSVIWFATADKITGPYSAATPIIYSGFNNDANTGNKLSYKNTNLQQLINNGTITGLRSGWFGSGGWYNSAPGAFPNAIDPSVFYDAQGKMWMVYGSFSGGIYILEIDAKTGKPIYPGTDGNGIDRYFGKMLLSSAGNGGNGEGPYILYDSVSKYYYLYNTYGGLDAKDGYNIRVFRSKNPDGPYVDLAGNLGTSNVNKGGKLFGNYQFSNMDMAYLSGGHSSALADSDGKLFQVYHTRFADGVGNGHQVRNHQMFVNEDGWTVVSPYEYNGETISKTGYTMAQMAGTYEFINHGNQSVSVSHIDYANDIIEKPVLISLNSDGTIGGAVNGTWTVKNNTPYVTLNIAGVAYKGVFCIQYDETDERNLVMTFAAMGNDNKTIWGSKKTLTDVQIVTNDFTNLGKIIPTITTENMQLKAKGDFGSTITWSSNNPSVISTTGKVTRPANTSGTDVTLTATIIKGTQKRTRNIKVRVPGALVTVTDNIAAQYSFDNVENLGQDMSGKSMEAASYNVTQEINIGGRDKVAKFSGNTSYLHLPSSLTTASKEITFISWMQADSTIGYWGRLVDLGDNAGNSMFITAKSGANKLQLSSAVNEQENMISSYDLAEISDDWVMVAFTLDSSGKITLYVNGEEYGTTTAKKQLNQYSGTSNFLGKSQYSSDAYFKGYMDDVTFYDKALTKDQIYVYFQNNK